MLLRESSRVDWQVGVEAAHLVEADEALTIDGHWVVVEGVILIVVGLEGSHLRRCVERLDD